MDWRNPEDYVYTENLSLRQWAWEFLRRSRTYRDFYDTFTKRIEAAWEGKKPGDQIDMTPMLEFHDLGNALGLGDQLPGPEVRADALKELAWGWGIGLTTLTKVQREKLEGRPGIVTLGFNLLLPIDEQLQLAETVLKRFRAELDKAGVPKIDPPKVRTRTDLWTIYLRLLDARNAGETIAGMGRVVYKDSGDPRKSAQNALRKAIAFSEEGYRQLLLKGDAEWGRGGN